MVVLYLYLYPPFRNLWIILQAHYFASIIWLRNLTQLILSKVWLKTLQRCRFLPIFFFEKVNKNSNSRRWTPPVSLIDYSNFPHSHWQICILHFSSPTNSNPSAWRGVSTNSLSIGTLSCVCSGEVLLTLQSPELRTWEFVLLSAFIRPLPTSPSSTSITTRSARAVRPSPPTAEITIGRWTAGKESCPTFVYAAFSFILSFNFPPPRQYSLKQFCTAKCYPRKLLSLNSRQQCNTVHTPHSAVLSRSVVSHSVSVSQFTSVV